MLKKNVHLVFPGSQLATESRFHVCTVHNYQKGVMLQGIYTCKREKLHKRIDKQYSMESTKKKQKKNKKLQNSQEKLADIYLPFVPYRMQFPVHECRAQFDLTMVQARHQVVEIHLTYAPRNPENKFYQISK